MTTEIVFREIRWFFNGMVDRTAWDWFNSITAEHCVEAYPRQDIYLVVTDRDDIGLKVREGRFEIKTRDKAGIGRSFNDGKIGGVYEDWKKETWDYKDRIGEISTPFEEGNRVRIVKARTQLKFEFNSSRLTPVRMDLYPDSAIILEITELFSQAISKEAKDRGDYLAPVRGWTIGCEAIAKSGDIEQVFMKGISEIFKSYNGPDLKEERSYGYPMYSSLVLNRRNGG